MSITKRGGLINDFNVMVITTAGTINDFQILPTTNTPANYEIDYVARMKYFNEIDHTAGCVKLSIPKFDLSEFGVLYYGEGSKYFKPKEVNLSKFTSTQGHI